MSATLRVRRSIQDLQDEYNNGNKKPLEDVMRAWKGIKELPPDDPRSFFVLGGYHGEPFRGAGWGNSQYWGGYCNHGNILFPTWHRVYLVKLEEALRSILGCADVTLPFWDETSTASTTNGIPSALTQKDFVLDGQTIPNPLRSFVFPRGIVDHLSPIPDADYSKPEGYETVRYPLSGLVGTDADKAATAAHNAQFPNYDTNVGLLNDNVRNWLSETVIVDGKPVGGGHVKDKYTACLNAPNYTVFSNTTSAAQWFDDHGQRIVPIESPHNSIHLAVGGFDLPKIFDASPIDGANGDMGENDTAGLDPIFFFHHCFVDRVFWLWQKKNGFTDKLEIIPQYPGTNSVDSQGPTPGTAANSWLTLESPLDPFKLTERGKERPYTSQDCINIETQLGYTYGPGSLDQHALLAAAASAAGSGRTISVRGLNRARIRGSFLISAFANVDGQRQHIGTEAVLSRWHVDGCANCQTHIEGRAAISTHSLGVAAARITADDIEVQVRTRDGLLGSGPQTRAMASLTAAPGKKPFKVELR
ncbi:tyrosinase family protein [Bradyrhizobium sp. CCGUVB4N]|uniref:tyrosinase family protein n=1 Tax=Bradyrhizobium sp. CCGUVB4N TaxID=2949631 RepID=UPI0020B422CD|nr:tyrosinase family protein [Bradyrhizobium sp. CCGUVB4N]MCP3383497.1 tyrosinase family protein [Bradyrhizobium sp. CCGUVB4N]